MTSPSTRTDAQLFDALRQGDAAALDLLFRRYYVDLCRTSVRLVGDGATAEDIVQELFAGLWSRRASLPQDTVAVGPYLRRAVRNRTLNYLRDRKRIPVDDGELPDIAGEAVSATETQAENDALRSRIDAAIDRLPERCRLIFVMSKVEHMQQREIAEALDISAKTVENQMTRAYKFLRQYLGVCLYLFLHYG